MDFDHIVELQTAYLDCKTELDAHEAETVSRRHSNLVPARLSLRARVMSSPPRDDAWRLDVDHFDGFQWDEMVARRLWLEIAPHMADEATIEFQDEQMDRWRIRWSGGRVYEEFPKEIIWGLEREITREWLGQAERERVV